MLKKINYIFNRKQKKQLIFLFFIIVLGSFAELISISAMMPVVYIIMDESAVEKSRILSMLYDIFCFQSTSEFITFILGLLIVIYMVKNLMLLLRNYVKFAFINNTQRDMAKRMLTCYIRQPYLFHTANNTATIQRNVHDDVDTFMQFVLACIDACAGGVLSFVLVIYLLTTDFIITISMVIVFGIFVLFFLKPFKKVLVKYGEDSRTSGEGMIRWINQSLGGIKEEKILEREDFFINKFYDAYEIYARTKKLSQFLNGVPGIFMEVVCMISIVILVRIRINSGIDAETLVPTLSVVALAGIKLLGAFSYLTATLNRAFYGKPSMEAVYKDLLELEKLEENVVAIASKKSEENIIFKDSINIENLSFQYPEAKDSVLDKISFTIPKGSSVAFIGPSGAGKTTLADLILGVLMPTEGKITIAEYSMVDNLVKWHKLFGYIPQNIYLLDDTIRNNIAFGVPPEQIKDEDVWNALDEAHLKEFVMGLESGLDTIVGEWGAKLSGGQRQRIGIARALYSKPEILVLDEATSALDNETEKAVMESIEHLHGKLTMIIIAHRLTTVRDCDYIYEINNRKVSIKDKNEIKNKIQSVK